MHTLLYLGHTPQRRMEVTVDSEASVVRMLLDGHEVFSAPLDSQGATYWYCFGAPDSGFQRILVRFRHRNGGIEDLAVWPDPDEARLQGLGLGKQQGCAYFTLRKGARSWPWQSFKDDLGAFVGQGLRFNLSHLLMIVFLYALAMSWAAASTGLLQPPVAQGDSQLAAYHAQRAMNRFLSFGLGWFLALPVFAAAAIGFTMRHPRAPASEQGWILVKRLGLGIAFGFLLAQVLYEGM